MSMQDEKKSYIFHLSFLTSSILLLIGLIILFLLSVTPGILLVGLLSILVGGIQILIDLGWIGIVKINKELHSWKEAFEIVIRQREQKFFLFPMYIDILFIVISLGTVIQAKV